MALWQGMYPDAFFECEADSAEEAQAIMKHLLLEDIQKKEAPLIVWENTHRG